MARLTLRNNAGTILFDTSGGFHWGLQSVVMGNQVNYRQWPYNQTDTIICGAPQNGVYEQVLYPSFASQVFVFRPMHTLVEPGGPRLVLRAENGQLIYHSGMRPLRIIRAVSNVALPGVGAHVDFALPPGRRHAFFALAHGASSSQSVGGSEYNWMVTNIQEWADYTFFDGLFRVRRGQQIDSYVDDGPTRPASWNRGFTPFINGIVVDITNY